MKKLFAIAVVLMAVCFFAQGAVAGDVCSNCKCPIERIPCAWTAQGGSCGPFDFDIYDGCGYRTATTNGYCTPTDSINRVCKAIFNICECPEPEENFGTDDTIGIRMTILVDGLEGELGAYWSGYGAGISTVYPTAGPAFTAYESVAQACGTTTGTKTPETGNFGALKYLKSDLITPPSALPSSTVMTKYSCAIPAAYQSTVLVTDLSAGGGYDMADGTMVENQLSHWWIDIPPIIIDRHVLKNNEVISVKIELLNSSTAGICAECAPVCECTIDVAIVCCETPDYVVFPYVLPGDQQWYTGIVLSNTSLIGNNPVAIANMQANLVLVDKNGTVFTYAKSDFTTAVWATWLNDILANFVNAADPTATPAVGPAYLYVSSNFGMRAFQFMTDGTFGGITLP